MTDKTPDAEPYPWMFEWNHHQNEITGHRAWLFKDVREAYEALPETSSLYKLRDVTEDARTQRSFVEAMLIYLGSWKCPDHTGYGRRNNWVNHRGKWATKYSDAATACWCGSVKFYTVDWMEGDNFDQPHAEECTRLKQAQTKALIWQDRNRILRQTAHNHLPRQRAAERFDVDSHSAMRYCDELNIDYDALQSHGFRKWRATMLTLEEQYDFSKYDLADVFGKSRRMICRHVSGNLEPYQPGAAQPEVVTSD